MVTRGNVCKLMPTCVWTFVFLSAYSFYNSAWLIMTNFLGGDGGSVMLNCCHLWFINKNTITLNCLTVEFNVRPNRNCELQCKRITSASSRMALSYGRSQSCSSGYGWPLNWSLFLACMVFASWFECMRIQGRKTKRATVISNPLLSLLLCVFHGLSPPYGQYCPRLPLHGLLVSLGTSCTFPVGCLLLFLSLSVFHCTE